VDPAAARDGLTVEALHELYAPPDASTHPYYELEELRAAHHLGA
jgi:hypothetical protein